LLHAEKAFEDATGTDPGGLVPTDRSRPADLRRAQPAAFFGPSPEGWAKMTTPYARHRSPLRNDMMRHRTLMRLAALLAGMALLMTLGCRSVIEHTLDRPEVSLREVRLLEMGLLSQRTQLVLHVKNPNPVPLPVRTVRYKIALAGLQVANGETDEAFTVPAKGETDIKLQVRTNALELAAQAANMATNFNGRVDYEISGEVEPNIPMTGPFPFSRKGEVALNRTR